MMQRASVPITVIILTHRNDRRFLEALQSAQPAQEVLVVDFDSGNKWPTLKKKAHFSHITRTGPIMNFAVVRNEALQKARHDWVFFLDSDEVITAKSWASLQRFIKEPTLQGVWVRRQDIFYGRILRFGETGHVWLLRLMRKNAAHFIRPVHEVAIADGQTARSGIVLLHSAHLTVSEFLQDISQYAHIAAEYQRDHELSPFLLGIKTIVYPAGKCIHNFFFRLGFLDGWRGFIYALMMSVHSVFVRVFSYENRHNSVS
jgi:glycosyltransferase involved in cell wall biosynthesis